MLAILFGYQRPIGPGRFFSTATLQLSHQRWVAFIVTLLVHLLFLWALIRSGISLAPESIQSMQLRYIPLPSEDKPEVVRTISLSAISLDHLSDNPPQIPVPSVLDPSVVVDSITLRPLTAEELRALIAPENTGGDVPVTGIAANVFNPALRKRLHEEASKPELQRADAGPKTYTDPSGATIVNLGGDKCLRSSIPKPGEAQNWYMTSCGGKSESEKIMENVNEAANGKLKFE